MRKLPIVKMEINSGKEKAQLCYVPSLLLPSFLLCRHWKKVVIDGKRDRANTKGKRVGRSESLFSSSASVVKMEMYSRPRVS